MRGLEQRLAAILAADVAGYTRLMADDEPATIATITEYRDIFRSHIEANGGRVVDMAGDSILAVFASATGAVKAAVDTQCDLARRNEDLPEARRMRFRVGVNLGDIREAGDGTVYGDGVNIAARLEGLAEPGGVMISEDAHRQVRRDPSLVFADAGAHEVKNVAEPVRAFRLVHEGAVPAAAAPPVATAQRRSGSDRPVIGVLPFANPSRDPEQDYFADGITEDIITELGRFRSVVVIGRSSVFAFKARGADAHDAGRELGVDYLVEGSVRKAGQRVRVTVQLVDADSGERIWGERYDRDLADIFALQDELTQAIVAVLPRRVEIADIERIKRKPTAEMSVYDRLLRAKLCHHRGTADDNADGLRLLDQAIEIDPEFAPAYAWRACTLGQAAARGFVEASDEVEKKIYRDVLKGLSLDDNDVECIRILCEFRIEQRRLDEALLLNDKASRLNPNEPRLHAQRGEVLTWLGRPDEAIEWLHEAMRLDPYEADGWAHLLGRALFGARRYEEALSAFKRVPVLRYPHHAFIAACCACLGDRDQAARERDEVLSLAPDFAAGAFCEALFYADEADRAHLRDGLVKAGLPA